MFNSLPTPVLIAHRGASAHAPENTLDAFHLAISQGVPAIELDVQLSADGKVVVFHDFAVSRTTNGFGQLHRKTLSQLKSLNAGAGFGSVYPNAKIPTLEEVFNDVDPSILLNIELKIFNSPFDTLPKRVADLIQKHQAANRVLISSFNPIALSRMLRHLPSVPRGLLLHKPTHVDLCLLFPSLISDFQSINVSLACITEYRVNALHKLGNKVFAYTLNSPASILHVLKYGVDGFFTDDPALGLRTLSESGYNNN